MSKLGILVNYISRRGISLTAPCEGKRNFRKFLMPNKRGSRLHKKQQAGLNRELEVDKRGGRETGYVLNGRFVPVPEMVPELIVPDLTNCELKPYVSYKAADVIQSEFTSQQLFDAVYSKKIVNDYKAGKLDNNYQPLEPSEDEKLKPDEAVARAKRTGSDMI